LIRRCVALTRSVNSLVHSSRLRLSIIASTLGPSRPERDDTYVTVEYSSSVSSCIRDLRREGMTYAGLCSARRPIRPTAVSRFSKTSSLSAMKRERTFSAWAKCLSNCSCRFARTACRIVASEHERSDYPRIQRRVRRTWVGNTHCE
jgi:hypothetical protein